MGIEDPVEGIIMVIMMIARIITDARYLLRVPVPNEIDYVGHGVPPYSD